MSKGVHGADHSLNHISHLHPEISQHVTITKQKQSRRTHQCACGEKYTFLALCHCSYVMLRRYVGNKK